MKTTPFSLSPSPNLLYVTPAIESTLNKIRHLVDYRQGLSAIMGDVGLGKSTILRYLWQEMEMRDDTRIAAILSPNFPTDFAFLKSICGEFGIPPKRSMVAQEQALREFLVTLAAEDRTAVVLVDEAQRLKGPQLEMVRTLLNFETSDYKMIQIVLIGQLELRTKLTDESKRALRSRIFAPSILSALSPDETRDMVQFRCDKAKIENPFPPATIEKIYNFTGGVPREVLKVCQIMFAMGERIELPEIPPDWVEPAASEVILNA